MDNEAEGGSGGDSARGDCPRSIRHTRLLSRALREGWEVPEEIRGPTVARLARIVRDPEASPREATSAARGLLAASKINLEVVATLAAVEKARDARRAAARDYRLRKRMVDHRIGDEEKEKEAPINFDDYFYTQEENEEYGRLYDKATAGGGMTDGEKIRFAEFQMRFLRGRPVGAGRGESAAGGCERLVTKTCVPARWRRGGGHNGL